MQVPTNGHLSLSPPSLSALHFLIKSHAFCHELPPNFIATSTKLSQHEVSIYRLTHALKICFND